MRLVSLVVCLLAGCPATPPDCIQVDTSCAPGYVPTFDNVYANTLKGKCGSGEPACHSATGRAGGMTLQDIDTAYSQLTTNDRAVAGNPQCSKMIIRTHSPGEAYQMPPGDPLAPAEQCALVQWVQMGAMR